MSNNKQLTEPMVISQTSSTNTAQGIYVEHIKKEVTMSNEKNIEQDRKYWYAKGKWDGSWKTFWICFGIQAIFNYYLIICR